MSELSDVREGKRDDKWMNYVGGLLGRGNITDAQQQGTLKRNTKIADELTGAIEHIAYG